MCEPLARYVRSRLYNLATLAVLVDGKLRACPGFCGPCTATCPRKLLSHRDEVKTVVFGP